MKTRKAAVKIWTGFILALVVFEHVLGDVLLPVISNPRPYKQVKMPKITDAEINNAFKQAKTDAASRLKLEKGLSSNGGIIPNSEQSAQARHQKINTFQKESRSIDEDQETFQHASNYLINKYKLNNDQAIYGLPEVSLDRSSEGRAAVQDCQSMFSVSCTDNKFRTADGSCNNKNSPVWGKSFTCFSRLIPPAYSDGLSNPRISVNGGELPNARVLSLNVHNDLNVNSRAYTHMVMQWGQFLDHDLTVTPMTRAGPNMMMIECCNTRGQPHPECFPISLPNDDPFFAQFDEFCMNFVRSATCSTDCNLGPRQQTNQLTAFIDGSNIYGSTLNDTNKLRSFKNGKLRSQFSNGDESGELLPPSSDTNNDQCSRPAQNAICFEAGDGRVNEQPGLTVMHTIWLRQHNRIATAFKQLYPRATDEAIFQESRRLVGAQLQMITYNEFLPTVLGPDYMNYFKLYVSDGYTKYDSTTQPSIVTEFSTAAYRFGHTLIQNQFSEVASNGQTGSLDLEDNYFFPFGIFNGELDPILQGLFKQPARHFDRHIVQAVTNHLYKQRGTPFGMDLPALNIQRGRDHGVPGYTKYLDYCFDIKISRFSDLGTVMTRENWQILANNYDFPDDIDLFTGGVAETPLPGGVVGPTFGCIIGLQFFHLKFGDRYYFEHSGQSGSFTQGQLQEIKKTTLAQIICANSVSINSLQLNVFLPSNSRTFVGCNQISDTDFRYWA